MVLFMIGDFVISIALASENKNEVNQVLTINCNPSLKSDTLAKNVKNLLLDNIGILLLVNQN